MAKKKGLSIKKAANQETKAPAKLDPVEDFNQPVRREPSSQETLPGVEQNESEPAPTVNGNKVLVEFVRLIPKKNKGGDRSLDYHMAVALTKENVKLFPEPIQNAHMELSHGNATRMDPPSNEACNVQIFSAADDAVEVDVKAIIPERVRLEVIESKGSTKTKEIIRLAFVLPLPQTPKTRDWGCQNHGELVWIELNETNKRLPLRKAAKA